MEQKTIIYREEAGIARIIMNRPQAMNAITPKMLEELKTAITKAGADTDVKVIVLTGAGKAFSAGVDLKSLNLRKPEKGKVGDVLDIPARELIEEIIRIPKAVIALVNGYCFTGALEIALACDLIIAAENAKIGDTHAKWGLRPTWGMSARLPRRIGSLKAKELSFTGEAITAKEAEHIGLVNKAVPSEKLEETLIITANKIMSNSPESVAAYKFLYNTNADLPLNESLELEFTSDFNIGDTEERLKEFLK
jgi:enoyl-CoA hydratase